jgi:glycerophosphoryl diester phosphodiesterase
MTPQVVAHRGASDSVAEHTLGAYQQAIADGADALECDVRLTADGHLVCFHDRDLRRTAMSKGIVSTMDLADLDQLDFSSWKNPWADLDDEADEQDPAAAKVLTMRGLLETVSALDRRVEIAIETKHPTRYAGLVERRLAQLLKEFGWTGPDAPVRVMSFSLRALQRMERLTPDLRLVMLLERRRQWAVVQSVVGGDWVLGPGIDLLKAHPQWARRLADNGHDLHVWTVNTRADLETCQRLGVKAVITDKPREMLDWLGR